MSRIRIASLALMLLSAARTSAAPAAAPSGPMPLQAGDRVEFDLSKLPESLEGEGVVLCVGLRMTGTGPVEARCERPFRFELPAGDARIVFNFRPAKGREVPVELPLLRSRGPANFLAPSDGTLVPPGPTPFPPEATEQAARKVAAGRCSECQGSGFALESFKVTRSPVPAAGSLPVPFTVTRTVGPSSK